MSLSIQTTNRKSLPKPLWLFLFVSASLTLFSWIVAFGFYLAGKPKPYSWPYYKIGITSLRTDWFLDLTLFSERFRHFHEMSFFSPAYGPFFPYPAPTALLYRIFLPNLPGPGLFFAAFVLLTVLVFAWIFVKRLIHNGLRTGAAVGFAIATVLLSEVLVFEIHQSNAEIFPFLLIALAVYFFVNGKSSAASVLLGVSIALKVYPVILLGLYLGQKKYREMVLAFLSAMAVLLLGFWTETPSIRLSAEGSAQGLRFFTTTFAKHRDQALGWDHSLFGLFKSVSGTIVPELDKAFTLYILLAAVLGVALYFLRVARLPLFNQIFALIILSILIPPVSFEYTLLELYSAFAYFCCIVVRSPGQKQNSTLFCKIGVCFGMLFSLIGFIVHHDRTVEGQVKALVLCYLLYLVLRYPVQDTNSLAGTTSLGQQTSMRFLPDKSWSIVFL